MSKSPLVSPPCGATPVPSRPTYLPKENQRAYAFVLLWSTQKGERMELQQPDNADEGEDTPLHGAQFLTAVRKNVSELKRRVDALHTKQEEVQQGQVTILSELRKLNGLVSSLGNEVNEVKRQRTQGQPRVALGWPMGFTQHSTG